MTSNSGPPRRLAIFSDIHGNLQALEAVLGRIDEMGIPDIICLGDVVGYGANPNECIETLRQRGILTLAGNHDHAAVDLTDITFFNEIAKRAVEWTRRALTAENAQWICSLPFTHEIPPDYYFVHASPRDPPAWNYVLTYGEARACFETFPNPFCFIGHSHQPTVVEKNGEELTCPEIGRIPIREGCRYLVNVGSVGQPRDRNPRACLVEVNLDTRTLEYIRVPYEVEAAKEAILKEELPGELAERLSYGY